MNPVSALGRVFFAQSLHTGGTVTVDPHTGKIDGWFTGAVCHSAGGLIPGALVTSESDGYNSSMSWIGTVISVKRHSYDAPSALSRRSGVPVSYDVLEIMWQRTK